MKNTKKILWFGAGIVLAVLGFLGLFLPFLQGILFLLLSLVCFAKASDRFADWLKNNKHYQKYLNKRTAPPTK